MASSCVPESVGGQDRYGRCRKSRFIADLPLVWYTGCVIEYLRDQCGSLSS